MSNRSHALPSRRQALVAGAAAFAVPYFVPRTAFGANDRVSVASIGVGKQGMGNLKGFLKSAQVVAVCDVDSKHLAEASAACEKAGVKADAYGDFRKVLERKDVDAVVVTTPDHWHALVTIMACEAGKDVYCEKPLTMNVSEGRRMVAAARKYDRVVQTGSQQRSDANFRKACELVRNGAIGKVTEVLVGIPGPNHPGELGPDTAPPPELNYNFWLGPAPDRPYNVKRVHYNFRFWRDYSGGQLTNWGAHHLDIAQWGLGMDDSGPVEVEGTAEYHPKKWHEVTEKCHVTYKYASGTVLKLGQGDKAFPGGTTFIGEKGKIFVTRGQLKIEPESIAAFETPADGVKLYVSKGHHADFLNCIKTREKPVCDVEIGHRSATVCHLANLACDLKRKLRWNPQTEQFEGDDEANQKLTRADRAAWNV